MSPQTYGVAHHPLLGSEEGQQGSARPPQEMHACARQVENGATHSAPGQQSSSSFPQFPAGQAAPVQLQLAMLQEPSELPPQRLPIATHTPFPIE
jgi:hypothetical protein